MQVQNEHLEKIFDTIASYDTCGANDEVLKYMDIEDFKLAVSQILALVKPEPLAKNKQTKSSFCDMEFTQGRGNRCYKQCDYCGSIDGSKTT